MLPSAAEMPPCAATVCERVGNTLVMHAVFRPLWARPNVARNPAPPAPTTIMSYLCSVILYAGLTEDAVMSASGGARGDDHGDMAEREETGERAREAGEQVEQLECDLGPARVHVVLDHDLHAELGVPEHGNHQRRHRNGIPRAGDGGAHGFEVVADQRHQQPDQPGHQQRQRDGGDALPPDVAGAGLAGPNVSRLLQRRAELVAGAVPLRIAGGADVAHARAPMAKNQIAAVSTTVSTATVQPVA